jgi:hypothetical protein
MDPATLTFLTGAAEFLRSFGVPGLVMAILILVMRAWQRGDFFTRPTHESILKLVEQRYLDLLERYKETTVERDEWKEVAERGIKAAELAQSEHKLAEQFHVRVESGIQEVLRELRSNRRG